MIRIGGVGTVVCGGMIRGKFKIGDELLILPGCIKTKIRSIEKWHTPVPETVSGDQVGINIINVSVRDFSSGWRGFLVGLNDPKQQKEVETFTSARNNAGFFLHINNSLWIPKSEDAVRFGIPSPCTNFIADIILVRTSFGKQSVPFRPMISLVLEYRFMTQSCKVVRILGKLHKNRAFTIESTVIETLQNGDVIRVEIETREECLVQSSNQLPAFSKFVLSDNLGIVAAGVVRYQIPSRNSNFCILKKILKSFS